MREPETVLAGLTLGAPAGGGTGPAGFRNGARVLVLDGQTQRWRTGTIVDDQYLRQPTGGQYYAKLKWDANGTQSGFIEVKFLIRLG